MPSTLQILLAGGLPLAADIAGEAPSATVLGAAVHTMIAEQPSGREAEALAALIVAWRHHWRTSFAQVFADPSSILSWADATLTDDDRYLKLRRIAIANLTHVL